MAGIGAESTLGAIAALAGLDKVSIERLWRDQAVEAQTNKLTNLLQEYRDKDLISQADFERALATIRPKAEALANEDVKRLTVQLDKAAQNDPVGTYERIREGNLGSLANLAGQVKGFATAQDKLSLQRFAGGNRGEGTGGLYGQVARQAQVNRDVLPLANTIYSNLGRDTNVLGSEQSRSLADYVNLLRERSAIPFRNAYTTLLPQQNRYNTLGQQTGALSALEQISRNNYLGTRAEENKWGRALKGFGRGLDEVVNTAADVGTSVLSSYTGGGGKGTNLSASQNQQPINPAFQPAGQGYNPYSYQQPFGQQGGYYNYPMPVQQTPANQGYDYNPQSQVPSESIPYDAYFTGYA